MAHEGRAAVDSGDNPAPGRLGAHPPAAVGTALPRPGDPAPWILSSAFSASTQSFLVNCGGQNHLDVARSAQRALERGKICVRTRGNRARGDSAPRPAFKAQKVLHRVKNTMTFERGPGRKVPAKVGVRLAGIAGRVVRDTGQALDGRCVTSGTSQEPNSHDGAREPQHPELSPLEAPRRPARRLPGKSHALSRMGATAGWRERWKGTHQTGPHGGCALHRV